MKKLLVNLMLLVSTSAANAGSGFTPLTQINALQSTDLAVWSYSLDRCSALYTVMAVVGDKVMMMPKKDVEAYATVAIGMLDRAYLLDYDKSSKTRPGFYSSPQSAKEDHTKIIQRMTVLYVEDLTENKTKTGNMFEGNFAADMKYCQRLWTLDGKYKY